MDREIKMPLKQGDMMHFQDLCVIASPAKSDASSVDIYDDLDVLSSTDQAAAKSSPSGNCLDLYEEIITEEGTAKEASFNDLSVKYEKCQRQMKLLIAKLKETQTLNSSLQNENQCLKKNISSLIKTARVEITRKEEEINRLNLRLVGPERNRNFKSNPLLSSNINKSKCNDEDMRNMQNLAIQNNLQSCDITNHHSIAFCDKEKACIESGKTCTSINPIAKLCLERTDRKSLEPCIEVNDKNKKEMGLTSQNKEIGQNEKSQANERPKSSLVNSVTESHELKEKTCRSPPKCEKNESSQEHKNLKPDNHCETENRKYNSSSTKEKRQLKDLDYSGEKHVNKYATSLNSRESKAYEKEKNSESRHRTSGKKEEPRRSKRTPILFLKDDASHKVLELSNGKRSNDSGRKDRLCSESSESKHENKYLKPSKPENSMRNKLNRENKTDRSDRDRRDEKKKSGDEKKRSRDEQERSRRDRNDKGNEKKERDRHQSSNRDKSNHCKVSEKNRNGEKAKVDNIQKDLKLSFMETLNLTLSPAKKTPTDAPQMFTSESNMENEKARDSSQLSVVENNADSLHCPKTNLRDSEPVLMDHNTSKVLNIEDSKLESHNGPVEDTKACSNEPLPNAVIDENNVLLANVTVENRPVLSTALNTVNSDEMATHSVADVSDVFDLDSFIEIDRCSGSPTSDVLNESMPAEQTHDDGSVLEQREDTDAKAIELKSNETEIPKELLPETSTKSTFLSETEELNKENYQPDKSDFCCKNTAMNSDEVEEGEILSDDEQLCKQTLQTINNHSIIVPDQGTDVNKSQSVQDNELLTPSELTPKTVPPGRSVTKHQAKIDTQPKLSANATNRKRVSVDSCLDGILKIVTPSTIQDVLQMLRIIRKHIRKKYMKFKIQFPLSQFHRIIEAATLYFITLVRSLDWSSLCSSPERLQKKLCRQIETRLKTLKKNGIVDRIFEQHLFDMKKRLWKFVEEQLDALFDTLKTVILNLCDKAEMEKGTTSCTNTQSEKKNKCTDKVCLPSLGSVPCVRLHSPARVSSPKTQNDHGNSVQKLVKASTRTSLSSEKDDLPSSTVNLTSIPSNLSPARTSTVDEPSPISKLNTSGLSFDLVSDDHMGDIFKSLLHISDDLPPKTLTESMWILGTPEKVSSQTFDSVGLTPGEKTPIKSAFWSSISPPHMQTFPRLESVLNPDVFDENCLLEIPTTVSSSKIVNGCEDRTKSYSSVLIEDLAVSLTVPSPLKSDSHLSFLRCDTEPVSEADVKCCQGSLLDEEDATEEDIHLTLESDNSSIGSLEDLCESGNFQYHPSEPMQAVIMEKSNDHFIVKIRRAVSSSSPVCDRTPEGADNTVRESLQIVKDDEMGLETRLETKIETHTAGMLVHPDHLHLENVPENSIVDVNPHNGIQPPGPDDEFVFKLPPNRSQHLEIQAEKKLTADITEHTEIDSVKSVPNCVEETCILDPPTDIRPIKTSDVKTVDLNSKKKKRTSVDAKPLSKRQKFSSPDEDKSNESKNLDLERSIGKKQKRTDINIHSSKVSPSSLSAKNVIKKKGEVVVSWTRDEDRSILLECQKLGPTKKTFLFLSSAMNKYPHQVEERFRQLMKLFKKSKDSSS
ncbi:CASP8-associated protein 2 isoform X2 [Engystomops pustulosus]|uniref:CASP8-associated protein 2 isoform X2 n=1 Tax=Engystomops pustulosus TaxID=76066 RepID=UPI003AFB1E3F